ncbi:MAG: IS110 family transposase [Bradyrhizobium sp.]
MTKHSKIHAAKKAARTNGQELGERWIGIDLGDRWSEVCVLDGEAVVIERFRVPTNQQAFRECFGAMRARGVAIETGVHSGWVSRVLTECGLNPTVANAREIRKIHRSDRKNDRNDAEILARILRLDSHLLSPVQHRSAQAQADLSILRARDALVGVRTKLINTARGLTKANGDRLPSCSAAAFARRVMDHIPQALEQALVPLLQTIAKVDEQIAGCDSAIETIARKRYPETALLRQVAGVGEVTSLAFVLTLGLKERFQRSRDVGPYLGLVPRQYDSGQHRSQLAISKAGNSYLRRLLVGSAHYITGPFGPDCRLRSYGLKLSERGGKNAKKRAAVAVARKLAVLLHHLWVSAAVYEPDYGASPRDIAA